MILTILLFAAGTWLSTFNTPAAILCYFFAVWCIPLDRSLSTFTVKSIAAILLIIFAAKDRLFSQPQNDNNLSVTFIDVGQGDSTLIKLPDHEVILIDAGTRESAGEVIKTLKEQNIVSIDYLIGTHPHADHIGGIPAVLKEFNVISFIEPAMGDFSLPESYSAEQVYSGLKQRGIRIKTAVKDDIIAEGDNWKVQVLSPSAAAKFDDLNDYSLIIKVSFGKTAFLFTGDAGYPAELEILNEDLACDVLKVGHHGSFGSTCAAFLAEADPSIGVISVGKENKNNLPNDYILQRLSEEGIQILRTDESGSITIVSDGSQIRVLTEKTAQKE